MNLYNQIPYKGYNINIYYDSNPESPRDWDNLGTFYTAHHRYKPEEQFCKHFERDEVFASEGIFLDDFLKKYIALPIYLYDHGGQTISSSPFSCKWDSRLFGMVAVSVEKVRQEFGWKRISPKRREQIEKQLQGEIESYDQYLQGEVYGFTVTSQKDESDTIDSCWGYYGNDCLKDIETECCKLIDYQIAA